MEAILERLPAARAPATRRCAETSSFALACAAARGAAAALARLLAEHSRAALLDRQRARLGPRRL